MPASSVASASAPKKDIATLMCVRAEAVTKKWGRGLSRKHVSELGVSTLNRSISWKHVHYVSRQIFEKEGFTRLRYKIAMCRDPNPADQLEVWRNSKKITDAAGGRLAPHPKKALSGNLMKNHLVLGLEAVQHGAIPWDHDNSFIVAPP